MSDPGVSKSMNGLSLRPITLKAANAYTLAHHRHSDPVKGHRWSVACEYDGRLCGVAICGRPIARPLDDGLTVEALRVCTDGTRNACSFLYAATVRIARAMGYRRWLTYTLLAESGAALRALGLTECDREEADSGREWDTPSRRRRTQAVYAERKWRWTIQLTD